jgi:hypothetical protein
VGQEISNITKLILTGTSHAHSTRFTTSSNQVTNLDYELPPNVGTASNQYMRTDGTGILTWENPLGSVTPIINQIPSWNGTGTQVQNNSGVVAVGQEISNITKLILTGTSHAHSTRFTTSSNQVTDIDLVLPENKGSTSGFEYLRTNDGTLSWTQPLPNYPTGQGQCVRLPQNWVDGAPIYRITCLSSGGSLTPGTVSIAEIDLATLVETGEPLPYTRWAYINGGGNARQANGGFRTIPQGIGPNLNDNIYFEYSDTTISLWIESVYTGTLAINELNVWVDVAVYLF